MMKTAKKGLALLIYILALAVLFLYLLFPAGAVKRYLEFRANRALSGLEVGIGRLSAGFPPAMVLHELRFSYQGMDALKIERLSVAPAYLKLLDPGHAFRIQGLAGGGRIRGRARIDMSAASDSQVLLELDFSDIAVDSLEIIEALSRQSVSGKLEGRVDYKGDMVGEGTGSASLVAGQCRIGLNPPYFGIKELQFQRAQAELEMNRQRLQIRRFKVDGTQFSGEGSGTVILSRPMENSRIQFSGSITPHPGLLKIIGGMFPKQYLEEGGIPVRISGTFKNPAYSLR